MLLFIFKVTDTFCTDTQLKSVHFLFPPTSSDESSYNRPSAEQGGEAQILDVSFPSGQSSCIKDRSAAARPGPAVDSLFNDSSIQHIIDRYTRELNISLSTAGKTAGRLIASFTSLPTN